MRIFRREQVPLYDLRVDLRHAVYLVCDKHRRIRHRKCPARMHIGRRGGAFLRRIPLFFMDIFRGRIYLHQYIRYFRQYLFQQPHVPMLQRFRQNRVVGIIENLFCDFQCRAEGLPALLQYADQFRYCKHGMRVVELYAVFRRKILIVVSVPFFVCTDNISDRRSRKEIFLPYPQQFPILRIVGRVQHAADLFRVFAPFCLIQP